MRSGLRGMLAGALGLIALQTLVSPGASGRVAALFGVPARIARRFLDPTIPAIPDRDDDEGQGLAAGAGSRAPQRWPDPFRLGLPTTRAAGGD